MLLLALSASHLRSADAARRIVGFNDTTATVFTGVYLAPHGTDNWGLNLALNDKDKVWDPGERLAIKGIAPNVLDLKVIDRSGHSCIKSGVDLKTDPTFDIRDEDLRHSR